MTKKFFELGGVKCPINDGTSIHFETKLVPSGINYVLDEEEVDYTKFVLKAAVKNRAVLLEWPKGTWKTTCVYYLAQETNNPLVSVQLNGAVWIDSFLGKWLVNEKWTYWVDWTLTRAMRYGYWLILDELNMALPEITACLNPVMDKRKYVELSEKDWEIVDAHPNFRLFAAINPTEDYVGTKEMNASLTDRFAVKLNVDYPSPRKERAILLSDKNITINDVPLKKGQEGVITRMIKVGNALRRLQKEQQLSYECWTRDLLNWAEFCDDGLSIKDAAFITFISKADKEERHPNWKIWSEVHKLFRDWEKWEAKKIEETETETISSVEAVWDIAQTTTYWAVEVDVAF